MAKTAPQGGRVGEEHEPPCNVQGVKVVEPAMPSIATPKREEPPNRPFNGRLTGLSGQEGGLRQLRSPAIRLWHEIEADLTHRPGQHRQQTAEQL
jgi:hypothetical protein